MPGKEDLKKEVKDILEIVKLCPTTLQEKCFEILLSSYLSKNKQGSASLSSEVVGERTNTASSENLAIPEDILKRVRIFSGQNNLSVEDISKAFTFDELGNVSIDVTDLKTTTTTKKQRRLALLIALRHQFLEGSLEVPLQELREMCVTYATYDAPNFSKNMKNMSAIFASFKPGGNNKLSPVGKKEAALLIKELIV